MFDIIFLDLDDTIFDFGYAEQEALLAVLSSISVLPTDEHHMLFSEINDAHWKRLERGELTRREVQIGRFRAFFDRISVQADAEEANRVFMESIAKSHHFIDGAEQLLQDLRHAGKRIYVVSNASLSVQWNRLRLAGLDTFFDGVFLSEEIGAQKPSREFFERVFERVPNMKPNRSIILGDSLTSDIAGGKTAGISTCWFNPKSKQGRETIKPDFEIRALGAFLTIVI